MTVSAFRTLTVGAQSNIYGVCPVSPPLRWPMAGPDEVLDYSLDVTALMDDAGDSIFTVTAAASPSGTGELALQDLWANGNTVTVQMGGGVAGRRYQVNVTVATASGRTFGFLAGILIDPSQATYPLPPPPNTGPGSAITWSAGGTMFGSGGLIISTGLTSTGSTQLSALPLPAVTNIFGTVALGTGAILPSATPIATYRVANAGANDLLVYPPAGALISGNAVDAPVIVSPNQSVDFMTQSATALWFAS